MTVCRKCGAPAMSEQYDWCYAHWRELVGWPENKKHIPRHPRRYKKAKKDDQ